MNGARRRTGIPHAWRASRFAPAGALLLGMYLPAPTAQAMPGCPATLDRSTPDADLVDNGNATITHLRTGLTWKQCVEGYGGTNCLTGVVVPYTWAQAQAAATAANTANFAGHNDWRLPNYKELESIVETGCQSPAISWTRFPNPAGQTWSSTSFGNAPVAWTVNFLNGASGLTEKTATSSVRLVRGGQGFGVFDSTVTGGKSSSGTSPTGTGTIGAGVTGAGTGCGYAYSQFVLPGAPPPMGVTLPHGLYDFAVFGCNVAGSLTVTLAYPAPLPSGSVFWAYGKTAGNNVPHWYILPATITGSQVQYTIVDGQTGDDDLAANGRIVNLGGPGTDRVFGNGFD